MNILADATLPGLTEAFPPPFTLTLYQNSDEIPQLLPKQEVLLCRSTLKVNRTLLKNHHLHYVATASSGTDHLDHVWLHSQNITVIDAKGSNARAVADYMVACLAYLAKMELIKGTKVGIIGLGEVGTQVAARLKAAQFQILAYDPLKAKQQDHSFTSCELQDLYAVDLLCIHAQLHDNHPYPSSNLVNQQVLDQLKPGCIIINAARGGIVNEEALLNAKQKLIYCTDVYLNEPHIDKRIIAKATLCTPHIAGHSLEAKYTAVAMVSQRLHQLAALPLPKFASPKIEPALSVPIDNSWQELVLQLYNPSVETLHLKQAVDKESAFLSLRQQHQKRHDFSLYAASILSSNTRLLCGIP